MSGAPVGYAHAEAERAILARVYGYLRQIGRSARQGSDTEPGPPKNDNAPTGEVGARSGA
jgi:hypothetical protein